MKRSLLALGCLSLLTPALASEPTATEQYLVELVNRARANGGAEATRLNIAGGLNEGPPTQGGQSWTIQNTAQPVAWNSLLNDAARFQALKLQADDFFFNGVGSPHTYGGTTASGRVSTAGYTSGAYTGVKTTPGNFFPGIENIAMGVSNPAKPWTSALELAGANEAHRGLFVDTDSASRGHRSTTMLPEYREVGFYGSFDTDQGGIWSSYYIVGDFGISASPKPFLTGVAYSDNVTPDSFYSPGEGIEGVTVLAKQSGMVVAQTTTYGSGGYSLGLDPGNYDVEFSKNGIIHSAGSITINSLNVKVDAFNPVFGVVPEPSAWFYSGTLLALFATVRKYRQS